MKDPVDFSIPVPNKFDLREAYDPFKIKSYFNSEYFEDINLLFLGEWFNFRSRNRNAGITAIDLKNGKIFGK